MSRCFDVLDLWTAFKEHVVLWHRCTGLYNSSGSKALEKPQLQTNGQKLLTWLLRRWTTLCCVFKKGGFSSYMLGVRKWHLLPDKNYFSCISTMYTRMTTQRMKSLHGKSIKSRKIHCDMISCAMWYEQEYTCWWFNHRNKEISISFGKKPSKHLPKLHAIFAETFCLFFSVDASFLIQVIIMNRMETTDLLWYLPCEQ